MPICPLCGGTDASYHARAADIEYKTKELSFDFHHCTRCSVLFIDPMLHDRLNEIYPANYYSFVKGSRGFAAFVKESLDAAYFRKALSVLPGESLAAIDVGGGTGWLLDLIKRAEPRITSTCVVDIDAAAKAHAEAAGHRYFLGRIEDFSETTLFDVVLMLNLVEHVRDPRTVLRAVRQLMTPHGRLFLKTPNFDSLDARIFRHHSWGGYHAPRHFVLFNRESMIRLCRECGLDVVHFSYTQGAPFWSVSALDMLRRMGVVRISAERPATYHPLMPFLQIGFAAFDFLRKPLAKLSQMQFVLKAST